MLQIKSSVVIVAPDSVLCSQHYSIIESLSALPLNLLPQAIIKIFKAEPLLMLKNL
jgi:hypothetical protein